MNVNFCIQKRFFCVQENINDLKNNKKLNSI